MNKELIKKYKVEFEHWMNGGQLLIKMSTGWRPVPLEYTWHLTDKLVIIDDEYVEFRKALAEGKTIQLNEVEKFSDQNRGWVDLSCKSLGTSTNLFPVNYYRVKPEEPKFKIGDVVQNFESVYPILDKKTAERLNSKNYCGPSTSLYNKIYDEYDSNKYIEEKNDYIEAKGGDGTLIRAIHKFKDSNKPFFGIAAGTENFLMNPENTILPTAVTKKLQLLDIEIEFLEDDILTTETVQAFNDIAIGNFNAWINFNCFHKDNILGNFNGSGLIISTSQGSTGSNKNNNGTILPLSSKNWSITGIMTNRKINYILVPTLLQIDCSSRQEIMAYIDGSHKIYNNVKRIKITAGEIVDIIFNNIQIFKEKRRC